MENLLIQLALGAIVVLVYVWYKHRQFYRALQNNPPQKHLHIKLDEVWIILERRMFYGKWYYVMSADKFPIAYKKPDDEFKELQGEIARQKLWDRIFGA
jgi:hypothetical protein